MTIKLSSARKTQWLACFGITAVCAAALGASPLHKALPDPAVVAADPQVRQVAAANAGFGFRLLAQLTKKNPGNNVFFSPFSVSNALTMALNGAGGATEQDMSKTLGLQALSRDQINRANGLLLPSLENPDPQVELSVANALWADKGVKFAPDFQERCRRFYAASAASLDFHSPAAADTINDWVKQNTHGKIDKLVSPAMLVRSPAVLTNAVYFHGQWSKQFDKAATQDGPFTLEDRTTKTLPLMSQTGSFPYRETPESQAVSLPYGTGRMSFYILLPKPGTDLTTVLSTLNARQWQEQIGQMHPAPLTIVLPRFKVQYQAELSDSLTALGMGAAFGQGADFKPMGFSNGFIGEVIHKAVLEVDEEGTVAAAATGIVMHMAIARPNRVMRVDHPFFCAIRDNTTGALLFAGIIQDPQ